MSSLRKTVIGVLGILTVLVGLWYCWALYVNGVHERARLITQKHRLPHDLLAEQITVLGSERWEIWKVKFLTSANAPDAEAATVELASINAVQTLRLVLCEIVMRAALELESDRNAKLHYVRAFSGLFALNKFLGADWLRQACSALVNDKGEFDQVRVAAMLSAGYEPMRINELDRTELTREETELLVEWLRDSDPTVRGLAAAASFGSHYYCLRRPRPRMVLDCLERIAGEMRYPHVAAVAKEALEHLVKADTK